MQLQGLSGTLGLNLLGIGGTTGGTLRDSGAESVRDRRDDWSDTQGHSGILGLNLSGIGGGGGGGEGREVKISKI